MIRDFLPRSFTDWWVIVGSLAASGVAMFTDIPRWWAALGWFCVALLWWLVSVAHRWLGEALALSDEGEP